MAPSSYYSLAFGSRLLAVVAIGLAGTIAIAIPTNARATTTKGNAPLSVAPSLADALVTHADHLLELNRSEAGRLGPAERTSLRSLLAEPRAADERARVRALAHCLSLGRFPNGHGADTGFIEDIAIVRVFAAATNDPSSRVRGRAVAYLSNWARSDHLARIDASSMFGDEDGLRRHAALVSRMHLEPPLRRRLASLELPDEIRAKLGDPEAESACVRSFEDAATYADKHDGAVVLGRIGTASCARALIEAFDSGLMLDTAAARVSIRCDLIRALGTIHPDEPLLTTEVHRLLTQGDEAYGPRNVREYLESFARWCRDMYGIVPIRPEEGVVLVEIRVLP